jgi:hypothetical protein
MTQQMLWQRTLHSTSFLAACATPVRKSAWFSFWVPDAAVGTNGCQGKRRTSPASVRNAKAPTGIGQCRRIDRGGDPGLGSGRAYIGSGTKAHVVPVTEFSVSHNHLCSMTALSARSVPPLAGIFMRPLRTKPSNRDYSDWILLRDTRLMVKVITA